MVHGARRVLARLTISLVTFLCATTSFGQAPGVTQGLAWLQQQVAQDGSLAGEGASIATPLQVRTESLQALSMRTAPPAALAAAVVANGEANTEFLSRRALALKAAGQNVDAIAGALLVGQSAGGGWGLADAYFADSLDTAYALQALVASGRSTAASSSNALAFLAGARLPEGGWGVNTATSVYVTSQVLLAADGIDTPAADAIVVAARDWLLAQRSAGQFGNTVDNSLAAIALVTQTDDPAVLTPIIDAIRAGQGADGSWGGDPYVTALALRALVARESSLAQLRGRVIHAISGSPIAGATVTLGTSPIATATTDALGGFNFSGVRSGTYSIAIAIPGFGTLIRSVGLTPGQSVDLGDLAMLPDAAVGAIVRGTISEFGTGNAVADAVVSVSVGGNTFSTYSNISGAFEVSGLAAGTAQLRIERTGYKVLTADLFIEAGRVYTYPVRLYPASTAAGQLDLLVIDAETGSPIAGAAFTLGAPYSVSGSSDAAGRLSFVGLNAGVGSFSLSAPGYNTFAGTVTIVSASTLFGVLPLPPTVPGTTARTLTGRVIDNVTRAGIPGVEVRPFQQDRPPYPLSVTDAEGRFTVAGYRGGTMSLTLTKAGYEGARFEFDPASNPSSDLGDFPMLPENIGGVLPDLVVGDIDRGLVVEAGNGALSGSLVVKVKNQGVRRVNGAFTVLAFLDANGNGVYEAGADAVLAQASVAGLGDVLEPNAVETVTLSLSGTLPFRDAPIHVWVDSGNVVAEASETNNIRTSAEFCRRCPTNAVVSPPSSGGLSMEPEFAGAFQPFNLGALPAPVPRHYGFYLPKKGDMCTAYVSGSAATAGGAIFAVRLVRDPDSRIIGFDKASFVATARGHGWGSAYVGDDGRFVVNDWSGPIPSGGSHGLYGYKPGDSAPGKAIRLDTAPYNIFSGSALAIVPPGLPGAGKFKLVATFGEWYSGQLDPTPDGYFALSSLARVAAVNLGGAGADSIRPQGLTYVAAGTPGFSRPGVIASDWGNEQVVTYEIDANGDPIRSTRRVLLRALGGAAGSSFDPVTGDLIVVTDNTLQSGDKVVALRTTAKPAALTDLSASRASVATNASGLVTSITVRIGNAGPAPAFATKVGFYAVRNGARGELLGEIPVAALAASNFIDLTFPVSPPLSAPGVMAVADSRDDLAECQETNNTAVVSVQALLGTVQSAVDLPAYSPGGSVDATATVTNPGAAVTSYGVRTSIHDAAGALIEDLGVRPVDALVSGGSTSLQRTWNVPAVLSGRYSVRATLLNAGGAEIGQHAAGFDVNPVPAGALATVRVTTDKGRYNAFDTVTVNVSVANEQSNAILQNLRVTRSIAPAAGGTPLHSSEATIAQLAPLAGADAGFSHALNGAAPGAYLIDVAVYEGAVLLARQTMPFEVESTGQTGAELQGSLAVAPADPRQLESLLLDSSITNTGNADIAALDMSLTIIDPADGRVVATFTQTAAAPRNQPVDFDRTWTVPLATPPGTYAAALSATVNAVSRNLAQRTFTVRDAPVLLGATTVTTDRASYDALETLRVTAHLVNDANGRPLSNIRVAQSITGPGGSLPAQEQAVAQLASGQTLDVDFLFDVARFAPGTYTVEQRVLDASGAVLDTKQVTFAVRSTAETGVGVTGTLSASPNPVVAGNPSAIAATLTNAGNSDAASVPVRVAIRDGAQALVVEFTATLAIAQAQPTLFASTWAVPASLPAGNYGATLSATFGSQTLTLAQTTIVVSAAAPQGTVTPRLVGAMRLAVLVSCAQGAANGAAPNSPDDPFCAVSRRQAIDDVLSSLGIAHKVTTSDEEFRNLLRCGEYDTFWIAGGAEKMRGTLAEEVREAVLRGGALVIDGFHDNRASLFDEVADVKVNGKLSGLAATVSLNGSLGAGTQPALGALLSIDALTGSTIQATFANGKPAILTSAYGNGKAAFFAYDFAATLAAAPSDPARRALLTSALAFVRPAAPSGDLLASSTVQVEIEVSNTGAASEYRVDAASPTSTQSWNLSLGAGETRLVGFALKLPAADGAAAVVVKLFRISGGIATEVDSKTLTLQVKSGTQLKDALAADLSALALPTNEQAFRNTAVSRIGTAWTKAGQGDIDGAMSDYLKADDELAKITSVSTLAYEMRVARLMQEAGLRGCTTATLSCGAPVWSPAAYSVLAFGSASMSNGQASGSVGIGGTGSLTDYQIAGVLLGDSARLNVAGSLSFSSGSVGQGGTGAIRVGGSASVADGVDRRELLTGVAMEDFAGLKAWYERLATNINALGGAPAVVTAGGTYTFTGTSQVLNVFTIPGEALGGVRALRFNVPDASSAILNVTGGAADWTSGQSFWNGQSMSAVARSSRVLYNFPAAGSVSVSSWSPQGTILAPNASLSINGGSVNGGLVVNTLSSNATGYSCPGAFEGTLPPSVMP